ncbi:MAG: S-methyl-5'-thioadenosine phosphorylase [Geothrix sp.]|uniref:S-methyl-5'-thioadenosine phosphorylase n=1 Tax=Geothrix sp. TaxID=1962974 RepID=UPI00181E15D6|nr:S-methyl-5'-thioadenosine phosphorylase [Geothrix sp.]NWJ40812.1 S-methyl-5'-thioadenosine phosphorylase [Geothrix sp.]WIL21186.1 MAG: S-methyl-5'-thioadenosine phosphorylase [Geothrix sp.]
MNAPIGIIGGSGLYRMEGLALDRAQEVKTPFGEPSGPVHLGTLDGAPVAFLARHGEGHRFTPSEVNYRANLWALKSVGVERLICVSAVGSLQARHKPGELRLVSQFIDKTKHRKDTYFGEGMVAHVSFAEPTCAHVTEALLTSGRALDLPIEGDALYVCMEGPAFSTRAESRLHQGWGADLIGMTQVTEARLAREAELCYACIALVTDYDAWREEEEGVDAASVLEVMHANVDKAQRLLRQVVPQLSGAPRSCACGEALRTALFTAPEAVTPEARQRLDLLVARYGYGAVR